jgi:hypothetical protein
MVRNREASYFDTRSLLGGVGCLCRIALLSVQIVLGRVIDIDPKKDKRAEESNARHSPLNGYDRPETLA